MKEKLVFAYRTQTSLMTEEEREVLKVIEREWGIEEAAETWEDWKNDKVLYAEPTPNSGNDRRRASNS